MFHRIISEKNNPDMVYPSSPEDEKHVGEDAHELIEKVSLLQTKCADAYEEAAFHRVCDMVLNRLKLANDYFNSHKPWVLAKDPNSREELNVNLYILFETIRVISIILHPIIPNITGNIFANLDVSLNDRKWGSAIPNLKGKKSKKIMKFSSLIIPKITNSDLGLLKTFSYNKKLN